MRLEGVTHIVHISYVSKRIRYAVSCVIDLGDISWYACDIKTRYEPKNPLSSFCEIYMIYCGTKKLILVSCVSLVSVGEILICMISTWFAMIRH